MWAVTIRLAWRNLWRNTRRTLITAGAIGLGLAAMILSLGWSRGMTQHLIDTVTLSGAGEAQIHASGWRQTRDVALIIPRGLKVLERVSTAPGVKAAAPRAYGIGLLAIGDRSANVEVVGFEPEREKRVTNWQQRLLAGRYPQKETDLLIGRDLAESLEVEVGSKLVLTVADAFSGDMNSLLVRVCGVIFTNNPALDKHSALLPLATVQKALGLKGGFHEIALSLDAPAAERAALAPILASLTAPGLEVSSWQDVAPVVANIKDLQGFFMSLTLLIIFFIVAFGIVNTMSMSLLERLREFGLMRAMGASPGRLGLLILSEAASLGLVGCGLGLVVGLAIYAVLAQVGLNMGHIEAAGVTLEAPIHPSLDFWGVAAVTLAFSVLTPLVAVFPALRAARVEPAKALRQE